MNVFDTDVATTIAQEVAAQVGELRFNLWFKENARLEMTDHELVVGVPNLFFQEWLSSNFLAPLRKAVQVVTGQRVPVRLVVDAEMFRTQRSREHATAPKTSASESPVAAAAGEAKRPTRRGQTFDNFVVGPSNRLAHAAALRLVDDPTAQFNPLVIYGSLGLGKTHLLRAIAHGVRERHRGLQVLYMSAEAFTNSFLEDMRAGRLGTFRQRMRHVDLLLVDDVSFMASKKATQAELLHTFEALDAEGKQVVLAADRHPRQIKDFSDSLVDRLLAGLTCPIEPPDFDTRVNIIESKVRTLGLALRRDVVEFVATHFRTNVRELEGALHSLKGHSELSGATITVASARQTLDELIRHSTKTVTLKEVEQAVCQTFDVRADQLRSASRSRAISQPRTLAMYLARKYTGAAYEAIGEHFGGRNHSTVMFAERKVQRWIDEASTLLFSGRPWQISDVIRAIEQRLK